MHKFFLCISWIISFGQISRHGTTKSKATLVTQWLKKKKKKKICLQCRRPRLDPWIGKIPWRRKWLPTPVFLPGNAMDRGAWWSTVHGVTKSWTWLIDLTVTTKSQARSMLDLLYLLQITLQKDEIFSYFHC